MCHRDQSFNRARTLMIERADHLPPRAVAKPRRSSSAAAALADRLSRARRAGSLPLGEGLRARRNGHSTASATDAGTLGSRNKEQY